MEFPKEDSEDEIEECPNVGRHNLSEMVKSDAVLKYTTVHVPAMFNRLEHNTNLNLPPSNWLMSSSSTCGLHQAVYQTAGFASFRMAAMFSDCVGNVDVISDAENIKQLLKLPYHSTGVISMVVHKIGNTLLLDEFDIQKYLLLKEGDEWKWLRNFIMEQLVSYGRKDNYCVKDKSRQAIKMKNLFSKFLYYSLKQTLGAPVLDPPNEDGTDKYKPVQLPISGPVLPEPRVEENMPDPKTNHKFNRNILWTFEDLRMLIGTDMPIFGGSKRPCISLRLREMGQPINVLTGIDYWLDNLMCNVPEVVMCYHLDGIVQKYEIIKTEDLPYLENSQFSTKVVRNVAQNILAFLKSNATKAGHTYWLFKARNDDVVKLYDLTTLCNNPNTKPTDCDEPQETPFTVPVGMLLYTVARNMKSTALRVNAKKAGGIKVLLENCIKLLSREKFPQIVSSSHYILSDLFIPAGIDPAAPKFDASDGDSETQSVYDEDDFWDTSSEDDESNKEITEDSLPDAGIAVQNIGDTLKEPKSGKVLSPPPLVAKTDERCRLSLQNISAGLSCLQFFKENEEYFVKESEKRAKDEEKQRIIHEEQNPNMAKPFKPIPLPYEKLKNDEPAEEDVDEAADQDRNSAKINIEDESKGKKFAVKNKKQPPDNTRPIAQTTEQARAFLPEKYLPELKPLQYHLATVDFNSQLFGSWNVHLKLLLLEKACLTYATLAEQHFVDEKFGSSLKAIYMSFRCQHVVLKYMSTIQSQKSCLLGRAGDCFLEISKNYKSIETYIKQFHEIDDCDVVINNELKKDLEGCAFSDLIEPKDNLEHVMIASGSCYEAALQYVPDNAEADAKPKLIRRLGNVRNELGLKYMHWCQDEYVKIMNKQPPNASLMNGKTEEGAKKGEVKTKNKSNKKNSEPTTEQTQSKAQQIVNPLAELKQNFMDDTLVFKKLAKKSYSSLDSAIKAFLEVDDKVNLALVYCNMGRFMRLRAYLDMPNEAYSYEIKQKIFYEKAFEYYELALDSLESRKRNSYLWDLMTWEYSTAMFNLARILQDYLITTTATDELEKDLLNALQRALKLCDVDHPGSRQMLYAYRAGLLHKSLGTFHYCVIRNHVLEAHISVPKATLKICKKHYEQASKIMLSLKEPLDFLLVQLERASLQEFLAKQSNQNALKMKHFQHSLEICLACVEPYENVLVGRSVSEENLNHILYMQHHLQSALKTLIKISLTNTKDPNNQAELYKRMYKETFILNREKNAPPPTLQWTSHTFGSVLRKLRQMVSKE